MHIACIKWYNNNNNKRSASLTEDNKLRYLQQFFAIGHFFMTKNETRWNYWRKKRKSLAIVEGNKSEITFDKATTATTTAVGGRTTSTTTKTTHTRKKQQQREQQQQQQERIRRKQQEVRYKRALICRKWRIMREEQQQQLPRDNNKKKEKTTPPITRVTQQTLQLPENVSDNTYADLRRQK